MQSTPINPNIQHELDIDSAGTSRILASDQILHPRHLSELNVDDSDIIDNEQKNATYPSILNVLPPIQVGACYTDILVEIGIKSFSKSLLYWSY